jgi:sn-glycerol 3-phosphate transport system ATP-binding protein
MAEVRLSGITEQFGSVRVIHGVGCEIADGEFVAILGPSGCGKSTLLRIIGRLELQTEGQVFIGPRDVSAVEPKDRDIAMVFQNYALYPHLSVFENMAYDLKVRGTPRAEIDSRVRRAARTLELVELVEGARSGHAGARDHREDQRRRHVALARRYRRRPRRAAGDGRGRGPSVRFRRRQRAAPWLIIGAREEP